MGYKKTCFNCQKSFNRPIDFGTERKYPCPDCNKPMILMSHKFRPPTKNDSKKWQLIEFLANNGFIFQSIFETPSGGTYIKYPTSLRDAKDFVVKYKEQSIDWDKKRNEITIKKQLSSNEINKLLEKHTSVIIYLYGIGYSIEYFYQLVRSLSNCLVTEIRPSQTICIEKDIETSYLYVHKQDLIHGIIEYTELRNSVFENFLKHLNITNTESVFSEVLKELRKTVKFNKGTFGDWSFWQHGGDIEFNNTKTEEHINVLMYNPESIKDWSLLKFLRAHDRYEMILKTISHKTERLSKLMDLLVMDGSLIEVKNDMRMKLITLEKKPRDNK
jgi:hypothetical protein